MLEGVVSRNNAQHSHFVRQIVPVPDLSNYRREFSLTHVKTLCQQGPYLFSILKNILCLLLEDFVNFEVTQILIG